MQPDAGILNFVRGLSAPEDAGVPPVIGPGITLKPITSTDVDLMVAQLARLRVIERAAWHALELAHKGHAVDAYAVLSAALEPK